MCLFATPTEGPPPATPTPTHTHTGGALSWCSNITDNLVGLLSWQRTFIVCHVAMALYIEELSECPCVC